MAGVTTLHEFYKQRSEQWTRCRDAASGSDAVKAAGAKYLPMLDSHKAKPEKFREYLLRALFYNATGRTVAGLSGAIFQKAPAIETKNAIADEHIKDITLTGLPLDIFALNITRDFLITGRIGILVDMSSEEAVNERPYWVSYRAEDIINWRFRPMGGDQELCLVVLREKIEAVEEDDEFDTDSDDVQYRVLRLTPEGIYTQQIYVEDESAKGSEKKYVAKAPPVVPLRRGRALDFIPFSLPWNTMEPPLLDLVDVNLSHYRGSADLKHGLHFTALPTPWVSDYTGTKDEPIAIGSGVALSLGKEGRAGMMEFTGKGLSAIREDLQDMQKMMATLGARLLEEAPHYAETALSVSMRHSSDYATLRMIAQQIEQQITWSLKVHVWWLGTEKLVADVEANVELNKVFYDQAITADELRALLMALQANSISFTTFYSRLQNTGWTREGVNAEDELKEIKTQDWQPPEKSVGQLEGSPDPKAKPGRPEVKGKPDANGKTS